MIGVLLDWSVVIRDVCQFVTVDDPTLICAVLVGVNISYLVHKYDVLLHVLLRACPFGC